MRCRTSITETCTFIPATIRIVSSIHRKHWESSYRIAWPLLYRLESRWSWASSECQARAIKDCLQWIGIGPISTTQPAKARRGGCSGFLPLTRQEAMAGPGQSPATELCLARLTGGHPRFPPRLNLLRPRPPGSPGRTSGGCDCGWRQVPVEDPKTPLIQEWQVTSISARLRVARGKPFTVRFAVVPDSDWIYGINISNWPGGYQSHDAAPVEVEIK